MWGRLSNLPLPASGICGLSLRIGRLESLPHDTCQIRFDRPLDQRRLAAAREKAENTSDRSL